MKLLCAMMVVFGPAVLVALVIGNWCLLGFGVYCGWEYLARDIWELPFIAWWQFALGLWGISVIRKIVFA